MKINILDLVTEESCYDLLREVRWSEGVHCPYCQSHSVVRNGPSSHHPLIRRYKCRICEKGFNDLSGTIFSDSKKELRVWILALYFLGLNLSTRQIAQELDMTEKTAQEMSEKLRAGIVKKNLIYRLAAQLKSTKFTS